MLKMHFQLFGLVTRVYKKLRYQLPEIFSAEQIYAIKWCIDVGKMKS